jgi:hypothetical protein
VSQTQPDAPSRQVIYAVSQLLWDPVDPINHLEGLADKSALWQVSVGDEQVPNFTVETLARSLPVPLVGDPVQAVRGLEQVASPTAPNSRGMSQFDSGYPRPPLENRPAEVTGAHTAIRQTEPMKQQVVDFFAEGAEGTIRHPCDGPCVFTP